MDENKIVILKFGVLVFGLLVVIVLLCNASYDIGAKQMCVDIGGVPVINKNGFNCLNINNSVNVCYDDGIFIENNTEFDFSMEEI